MITAWGVGYSGVRWKSRRTILIMWGTAEYAGKVQDATAGDAA